MKYSLPIKPPMLMKLDGREPIPYNCSPTQPETEVSRAQARKTFETCARHVHARTLTSVTITVPSR